MAESTTTDPLTTIFTPPATCVSHWTYEGEFYNSISGGLLIQDVLQAYPDTDCFPTDFSANGRAPAVAQVYSPGACPIGYSTAENFYNGAVTTAVCCLTYVKHSTQETQSLLTQSIIATSAIRPSSVLLTTERARQNFRAVSVCTRPTPATRQYSRGAT